MTENPETHGNTQTGLSTKFKRFGALYIGFTTLLFLYFGNIVLQGHILAPDDDRVQSLPGFLGEKCLWTPLLAAGWPLHADPLVQMWYPIARAFEMLPMPLGWNLYNVSGFSLCAVFMYLYVHEITGKKFAALIPALIFPLTGAVIAEVRHNTIVHPLFYCLALLFVIEKLCKSLSFRWVAAGVALVGLCTLNGHYQLLSYILSLAGLYSIFKCFGMGKRPDDTKRFLLAMFAIIAVGCAIGMVQVLPTSELARASARAKFTFADFLTYCNHPLQAIGLFTPLILGTMNSTVYGVPYFGLELRPPHNLYLGFINLFAIVAALLLGLWKNDHSGKLMVAFWFIVLLLTFLLSFGDLTPLAWLLYHFPPFGSFRALSRFYLLTTMASSVITGLVLGRLQTEQQLPTMKLITYGVASLSVTALGIIVSVQVLETIEKISSGAHIKAALPTIEQNPNIIVPVVVASVALALLITFIKKPHSKAVMTAIAVLAFADVGYAGWFTEWNKPVTVASMQAPSHLVHYEQDLNKTHQRMLPVRGVSGTDDECPVNLSRLWRMPSASGFSPLLGTRYLELLGMTEGGFLTVPWTFTSQYRGFDILAIKYLFVAAGDTRLSEYKVDGKPVFEKRESCGNADIYENTRAMPRAWLAPETYLLEDQDILKTIRSGKLPDGTSFDPMKVALLNSHSSSEEYGLTPPPNSEVVPGAPIEKIVNTVDFKRLENETVELTTDCNLRSFLVLSDSYYPGWELSVDGNPTDIIRADYALRGAPLSAGKHQVSFTYRPKVFYSGAAISLSGILLLAALTVFAYKRK